MSCSEETALFRLSTLDSGGAIVGLRRTTNSRALTLQYGDHVAKPRYFRSRIYTGTAGYVDVCKESIIS